MNSLNFCSVVFLSGQILKNQFSIIHYNMFLLGKDEISEYTYLSSVVAFWHIYSHLYVMCKMSFILHVIQLSSPGSDFLLDVYLLFS